MKVTIMENIPFIKMHGLGNDFVIVDIRESKYSFTNDEIRKIADRHKGVGCDQFVTIDFSNQADCFVRFYNADGGQAGACGNASRCVAWLIMNENNDKSASLETLGGILNCTRVGDELVSVDMGQALNSWQDIPLSKDVDTLHLPVSSGQLKDGVAVSMGNPHAVFFVNDVDLIDLSHDGAALEVNNLFPEKANISIAQIISENEIKLRVWERGVGETSACGTGACATAVAANRRGLVGNKAKVCLPGGELFISYEDNQVIMTGPVTTAFKGVLL